MSQLGQFQLGEPLGLPITYPVSFTATVSCQASLGTRALNRIKILMFATAGVQTTMKRQVSKQLAATVGVLANVDNALHDTFVVVIQATVGTAVSMRRAILKTMSISLSISTRFRSIFLPIRTQPDPANWIELVNTEGNIYPGSSGLDEFHMGKGDTRPALEARLSASPDDVIEDAQFFMFRSDGTTKINSLAGIISQPSATSPGRVKQQWGATDMDTPGRYYSRFVVTYADGRRETYPNKGYIPIIVGE